MHRRQPEPGTLASVKDYLNVPTNMSVMTESRRVHHRGTVAMLSGGEYVEQDPGNANYRSTFTDPSIDQVAAAAIGAETPFRSIEVGISSRVAGVEGTTLQHLSHNGPDNTNPPELDPGSLYGRLFADTDVDEGAAELNAIRSELRSSVLDAVHADAQALHGSLGSRDRVRLEQHMQNIRELEQRLSGVTAPQGGCVIPTAPGDISAAAVARRSRSRSACSR